MTNTVDFEIANLLAADIAGSNIDPNEGKKALSYLRSTRDPQKYFTYLRSAIKNGHIVIRSRQTVDYYKNLLEVSERHLEGMQYEEMVQTLGWALRLAPYYKTVPDTARELKSKIQAVAQERAKPKAPTIPQIGEVFAGKVIDLDETVVLIEIPGFADDKATGVLKAEQISDGRTNRYKAGNSARVEVVGSRTLKSGRVILELKPAPKEKN
jgi:hypothetical protein